MQLGYRKPFYLLPFDHRSTFAKELLGLSSAPFGEDKKAIRRYKEMIYEAFEMALSMGVPAEDAAMLVDEEYGEKIFNDAHSKRYVTCLTVEKSGQSEFTFEYGDDFRTHIKKMNPVFVKALIHYNPDGDEHKNKREQKHLRELSDFAHSEGYKFLLEPLIPPTKGQLSATLGDTGLYDRELRPLLAHRMMRELQEAGVEPDIWKLEGMEREEEYRRTVAVARNTPLRRDVSIVILGRGEDREGVVRWLKVGRKVEGVVGFAVGRTVFMEPLQEFREGKTDRAAAVRKIAANYLYFYDIFRGKQ